MSKIEIPNYFIPQTKEEWEELARKTYKDDLLYPENFSNWYNEILDFGMFKHTEIISNQIFTFEESEEFKKDYIEDVNWNKVKEILKPTLDKMEPHKLYNIKNGSFSNKFNFDTCITNKKDLPEKFYKINYNACLYGAGGYNEIVVRDIIQPYNPNLQLTIYNGMPLRDEVRVFYNMKTKQIEYMVDYWDYEYCSDNLSKTDKVVFDFFHNKIAGNTQSHKNNFDTVCKYIQIYINGLKFSDKLTGVWSIDFMPIFNYNNISCDIYLIDMARGYNSAYWNFNKLKPETQKQLREE